MADRGGENIATEPIADAGVIPGSATLLRKTAWSAVAGVLNLGGSFLCGIIIARTLDVDGYGQFTYLVWLAGFVAILTNLGIPNTLSRFIPALRASGKVSQAATLSRLLLMVYLSGTLLAMVVIYFARSRLHSIDTTLLMALFIVFFLSQSLTNFCNGYLAGTQQFSLLARLMGIGSLLQLIGVSIGAWKFGVAGAIVGYILSYAIPAILALTLLRKGNSPAAQLDNQDQPRIFRYAIDSWLTASVSAFIWSRLEVFFLDRYRGAAEVAMYGLGLSLAALAAAVPGLLGGALLPHLSERAGAEDLHAVHTTYASAARLLAFLFFPSCFICAAVMPILLPTIYSGKYQSAVPTAMVLVFSTAFGAAAAAGTSLQYALERQRFILWLNLVAAPISILLYMVIVPRWGMWGAAWNRAAIQFSVVCVTHWYISARMRCPVPVRAIAGIMIAAFAGGAVAYCLQFVGSRFVGLPLAILVGSVTYLAAARALHVLHNSDLHRLRRIIRVFPRRLHPIAVGLLDTIMGSGRTVVA